MLRHLAGCCPARGVSSRPAPGARTDEHEPVHRHDGRDRRVALRESIARGDDRRRRRWRHGRRQRHDRRGDPRGRRRHLARRGAEHRRSLRRPAALTLDSASLLAYDLGAPNVVGGALNDLIQVNGNLALGGVLNVTDAGSFAATPGSYRLMNFSGALTGGPGDVTFGALPGYAPGDAAVQTVIAGQVNLIVAQAGLPVQFWDGPGGLGDGIISAARIRGTTPIANWTTRAARSDQAWLSGWRSSAAVRGPCRSARTCRRARCSSRWMGTR